MLLLWLQCFACFDQWECGWPPVVCWAKQLFSGPDRCEHAIGNQGQQPPLSPFNLTLTNLPDSVCNLSLTKDLHNYVVYLTMDTHVHVYVHAHVLIDMIKVHVFSSNYRYKCTRTCTCSCTVMVKYSAETDNVAHGMDACV